MIRLSTNTNLIQIKLNFFGTSTTKGKNVKITTRTARVKAEIDCKLKLLAASDAIFHISDESLKMKEKVIVTCSFSFFLIDMVLRTCPSFITCI